MYYRALLPPQSSFDEVEIIASSYSAIGPTLVFNEEAFIQTSTVPSSWTLIKNSMINQAKYNIALLSCICGYVAILHVGFDCVTHCVEKDVAMAWAFVSCMLVMASLGVVVPNLALSIDIQIARRLRDRFPHASPTDQ